MEASALRMGRPGRIRLVPPRLISDEALVQAVRAGDRGAFEVVFDRYHRRLLSFCRHMLGVRDEAEDAVQQTFLAAYRDLCSSTKRIHLRPWLYTIARNQCLLVLRRRRERVGLEDVEPATEGLSTEVQRREELRQMLVDVSHLPEDQRAALLLAELGDLSHPEIARVVGCRREKVKALVFQARESLASSRAARETPCSEVRAQLATLKGGALRRTGLRRHVSECAACRSFEADVKRQRRALAVVLPVTPMAALKPSVLAGLGAEAGGAASAGGSAAAAGAATTAGGGLVPAKLLAIGVVIVTLGVGAVLLETTDRFTSPQARVAEAPSWLPARPHLREAVQAAVDRLATKVASFLPPARPRARERIEVKGESRINPPGLPAPGVGGGSSQGDGGGSGGGGSTGGGGGDDRSKRPRNRDAGTNEGSSSRGRSDQAPGRRGTTPGQSGNTPGQSGNTPAHGEPPPGQADTSPGKAGETPGQSGDNPGKSGGGKKDGGKK